MKKLTTVKLSPNDAANIEAPMISRLKYEVAVFFPNPKDPRAEKARQRLKEAGFKFDHRNKCWVKLPPSHDEYQKQLGKYLLALWENQPLPEEPKGHEQVLKERDEIFNQTLTMLLETFGIVKVFPANEEDDEDWLKVLVVSYSPLLKWE